MPSAEELYIRMLNRLRAGAAAGACGARLAAMDGPARLAVYSNLLFGRMKRKAGDIADIYRRADSNWNQTLFIMYMRTLGDASNRESFMRLAWKITCNPVLTERGSLRAVEALLLGTSGLLEAYDDDDYTRSLKSEFTHLSHKYGITPMSAGEWNLRQIKPLNHPVLRLAQAAAFFTEHEFVCRECLECRTAEDVGRLFGAEASDYWSTHFTPGNAGDQLPKRIGRSKAELIGINLAAPLQFAYGMIMEREELRERAMELLESIAAEDNRYIRRWESYGVAPANAFDTQALLQLATEYCDRQACEQCPVGRRILGETVAAAAVVTK